MQQMNMPKVFLAGLLVTGSLFLSSCAPTVAPLIVKSEGPYVIGDRGPTGGWIIHDKGYDSDGWRYLEAAPEDQTTGWTMGDWAAWGCNGKSIPSARYIAIGTGMRNTRAILQACDEPLIAARRCADYRGGGKDDWFLPSLDELNAIYTHLYKHSLGGLGLSMYWSSSETTKGGYAWNHNFTTGDQSYCNKWPKYRVRCVRAFSETPAASVRSVPAVAAPSAPVAAPSQPVPVAPDRMAPLPKGRILE